MSKPNSFKRLLAGIVAASVAISNVIIPVSANEAGSVLNFWKTAINANPRLDLEVPELEKENIPDDQVVRVSIVLEDKSTIDAGYDIDSIATDSDAIAYRDELKAEQDAVVEKIEKQVLRGQKLDVVWNLTLAANIVSVNVEYGKIAQIRKINGVKDVVLETQYAPASATAADKPNMGTSSGMIGSGVAYSGGYTGAGSLVAIIDTGIDSDHQSFDAGAFEYSLDKLGYTGDLLTQADIAAVLTELNIYANGNADASKLYLNSKVPFAYNYVDENYDITHDNDSQGEHGSHVTGIAAANAYIPNGDGTYSNALSTVLTQGVAPDAQIITMKVFGKGGGAYDSDYMAAIEDAIVLGADSINLSLGSNVVGFGHSDLYEDVMDSLTEHGAVVTMSAGNSGNWAEDSYLGYLYTDDVSFATGGSPGSFTHSLGVASIDNDGATGEYLKVGDELIFYTQTSGYGNPPYSTLAGKTFDFVVIDNFNLGGEAATFTALADIVEGKIAVCYRGGSSFYEKANAAWANGAAGVIVINNQPGTINMDLTGYLGNIPVVSVTYDAGEILWDAITSEGTSSNGVYYGIGSLTVGQGLDSAVFGSDYYTMSSFSSWGVPGTLEMKPEITAPGGSIYSVNGLPAATDQYELMSGTSMAAPQVAGMTAVLAQYIRENDLLAKTGLTQRQLVQSLLMSTAVPVLEEKSECFYSVLNQGAGLANVGAATQAHSYIMMDESATLDPNSAKDGKVKVELGETNGKFSFTFTINNFSDEEMVYTLDTSLFTQDISEDWYFDEDLDEWVFVGEFLDTRTVLIDAAVSYDFSGITTDEFDDDFSYDVNKDGFTTPADAQAILEYLTNGDATGLDLDAADVDGDESVTTFDAYLILVALKELVLVPAGESVEVTVNVNITEDLSAYVNGAYIEGYTFIEPVSNDEDVLDVTYSIPILGFYGNWTDPSMYEAADYIDYYIYDANEEMIEALEELSEELGFGIQDILDILGLTIDDLLLEYSGRHSIPYASYINALWIEDSLDGGTYPQVGNPYVLGDFSHAAIRSTDTLAQYNYGLIRNAGTVATVITDKNGKVLALDIVDEDQNSEFFNQTSSGGSWQLTGYSAGMDYLVSDLGVKEGDVINVSVVAIPEYYGTHLSAAQVEAVLPELGDGAFLTTTMTVDDTAPVVPKDGIVDNGDGTITVTVKDNGNVAYVALISRSGAVLYDDEPVVNGDSYTLDASYVTGHYAAVFVADYAGNEAVYEFEYGDPIDYEGTMFGYSNDFFLDYSNAWAVIDPSSIDYWTEDGAIPVDITPIDITASAYADGYIFQVGVDGALYIAPIDDPGYFKYEAAYLDFDVVDLAFNYSDSQLYALDNANGIWKINPLNGKTTFVGEIVSAFLDEAMGLTIDAEGNFYAAGYFVYTYVYPFLYTWTDADIDNYVITPEVDDILQDEFADPGVLAYDYDNDLIYLASDAGYLYGDDDAVLYDWLWVIDLNEETIAATSEGFTYGPQTQIANLGTKFSIFVVPSETVDKDAIDENENVEVNITVNTDSLYMVVSSKANLEAIVSPWTLEDTSVTWSSADTKVATVDADGRVTAVGEGETTITAAAKADPTKTATVTVTVVPPPSIELNAMIWDVDATAYWSSFTTADTEGWTPISPEVKSSRFYAGTLAEGVLYAHNGSAVYAVDPVTFAETKLGEFDFSDELSYGIFSDAAAAPALSDGTRILGEPQYNASNVAAICVAGQFLEFINLDDPDDSTGFSLLNSSRTDYLFGSPAAAIAYIGLVDASPYADEGLDYIIITEDGTLGEITLIPYNGNYAYLYGVIGETGLDLSGVSDISFDGADNEASASLEYDEETGYLILTSYTGLDTAYMDLISISEDGVEVIMHSGFLDDVWPVVALYQSSELGTSTASWAGKAALNGTLAFTEAISVKEFAETLSIDSVDEAETEAVPASLSGSLNAVNDEGGIVAEVVDVTEDEITDEQFDILGNALTIGEAAIDTDKNTVTIPVSADRATNALYELTYDSSVLKLDSVDRLTPYSSHDDGTASVLLNFASADAVSDDVSVLVFTYDEKDEAGLNTEISLIVYELGVENEDGELLVALGGSEENPITQDTAEIELIEVSIDLGGHGTTDAPSTLLPGQDLDFTITPDEGYGLPETITVKIGGEVLDPSKYTYDPTTGKVHIPGEYITGKVEVIVDFIKLENPVTGFATVAILPAAVTGAVMVLTKKRRR